MSHSSKASPYTELLNKAGMRVTAPRLQLLAALEAETKPISVLDLRKKLGNKADQVTIYRFLESLQKAGFVKRIDLGHDHAHFELANREHHHHVICRNCGRVEDIDLKHEKNIEKAALAKAKGFSSVSEYSLEFFGTCKKCA